jgi:3-phenylpropionate/trans-cinnamate dioxygenase ferredoxin component
LADFTVVGNADDVPSGAMKEFDAVGIKVLVARVGDNLYATQGRCAHMGGVLAQGKLEGTIVTCPRHHSQFDLKDGRVVRWVSGKGFGYEVAKILKAPTPLKVYEVKTTDGKIQVRIE